jgi:hypothetical protein
LFANKGNSALYLSKAKPFFNSKLTIMKKMQSLGRSLSKNQQRQVVGGMPPVFKQATCVCWNGPVEHTCELPVQPQ